MFHPEHLDATTDQVLDILELRVDWHPAGEPPRFPRVLRGDVRAGRAELYIDDVRHGVELDAQAEHGPAALFLGAAGPDAFVTVSAWREWAHIERATGGNVAQPMATRHPERLLRWHVEHFELVDRPDRLRGRCDVARPPAMGRAPARPAPPIATQSRRPEDTDERDHPAQGRPRQDASKLLTELEIDDRARRQDARGAVRHDQGRADLHEIIEEEIFYPELKAHPKAKDIVLEGYEEHHVVDLLMGELEASTSTTRRGARRPW